MTRNFDRWDWANATDDDRQSRQDYLDGQDQAECERGEDREERERWGE